MENKLDLPFGPWYEIFSGTWSNYDIAMLQNPDKLTLTIIFDKERDKVEGMVLILDKYYVVEGDPTRLASAIGGYNVVFEKMYPVFKKKYFVISSGPKYAKADKDEIDAALQEVFTVMNDTSERANELARSFAVNMTELKYAKEEEVSKLFSEPILMPALGIPRGEGGTSTRTLIKTLLGKKTTGEKAEESVQSFAETVVIGSKDEREQIIHVLLENCVLGGMTTVVFDENKRYERMATPNKNFDYKAFPDLQPIGMPLKDLTIQQVTIDLNIITPEMFREIVGFGGGGKEFLGKDSAELMDGIIANGNGQLKTLAEIEEKLLAVKDEVKKFHIHRAVRMLKVMEMAYPGYFGGKVDLTLFVSPYMRNVGALIRLDISGLPSEIKSALIYSVMASLYRKYKEEMATKELKVVSFVVDGARIAPTQPETALQNGMVEVLADSNRYGVGFCLGAEHETDLNQVVSENVTMRLEMVDENEVAVREVHSRPYRLKIRPNMSA